MSEQPTRIGVLPEKDKLWELYLHTLAGWHGNADCNGRTPDDIAKCAIKTAKIALKEWNNNVDA